MARGSEHPKPGKCGRRLSKTNPPRYCTQSPLKGRDCCKFHGGRARRGPSHPNYQHGRFSKVFGVDVPYGTPFGEAVRRALADHRYRGLKREIAVATGLLAQAMARIVDGGGSAAEWAKAQELFGVMEEAIAGGKIPVGRKAMAELKAVLVDGALATAREREAGERADGLRRLRRDDARIALSLGAVLTAEEYLAAARVLAETAAEFVEDPKRRAQCFQKFEQIVTSGRVLTTLPLPKEDES